MLHRKCFSNERTIFRNDCLWHDLLFCVVYLQVRFLIAIISFCRSAHWFKLAVAFSGLSTHQRIRFAYDQYFPSDFLPELLDGLQTYTGRVLSVSSISCKTQHDVSDKNDDNFPCPRPVKFGSRSCKRLHLLCPLDPWNLPGNPSLSGFYWFKGALKFNEQDST